MTRVSNSKASLGRGQWAVRLGRRGWWPGRGSGKKEKKGGVVCDDRDLNVESLLCDVRAALGGAEGVVHVLRMLLAEVDLIMAVDGYPALNDLTRESLRAVNCPEA